MDSDSLPEETVKIRWAPRVRPEKIRRLYETEARGILDEELLNEVAYSLYARCRAILRATEAHEGRVECPRCAAIVPHDWNPEEELACDCGWRMAWRAYHRTYQGKKLHGGGAVDAFRAYLEAFDRANAPRDVMLAIDRLIHAFHHELSRWPTSPAAKNVIDGNIQQIVELMNSLAYGPGSEEEMQENLARYQASYARSWVGGCLPDSVRQKMERRAAKAARREAVSRDEKE